MQSQYPDIVLTRLCPMLLMSSVRLDSDKYQVDKLFVWLGWDSSSPLSTWEACVHIRPPRPGCTVEDRTDAAGTAQWKDSLNLTLILKGICYRRFNYYSCVLGLRLSKNSYSDDYIWFSVMVPQVDWSIFLLLPRRVMGSNPSCDQRMKNNLAATSLLTTKNWLTLLR